MLIIVDVVIISAIVILFYCRIIFNKVIKCNLVTFAELCKFCDLFLSV